MIVFEQAGIQPTLGGVATAAAVPVRRPGAVAPLQSPLHVLEKSLAPLVAYLICRCSASPIRVSF